MFQIHLRITKIFVNKKNEPFTGLLLTDVTLGDLLQCSLVGRKSVYAYYENDWQNLQSLWSRFEMRELTEVMR